MGFSFHHHNDSVFAPVIASGMFESETIALLSKYLKPGMTFVDVGANIGVLSLIAARLVGDTGTVFSFEPGKRAFETLQQNVNTNGFSGRIIAQQCAIGERDTSIDLFVSKETDSLASFFRSAAEQGGNRSVASSVPCTSLDHWADRHEWPPVDVVKIDVEGAEVMVLSGMTRLMKQRPTIKLLIEFNTRTLAVSQTTPQLFFKKLAEVGITSLFVVEHASQLTTDQASIDNLLTRMAISKVESVNLFGAKAPEIVNS